MSGYTYSDGYESPDGMSSGILRDSDGAPVPLDPNDPIYQEYLAWVREGNEPTTVPAPPPAPLEEPSQYEIALSLLAEAGFLTEEQIAVLMDVS